MHFVFVLHCFTPTVQLHICSDIYLHELICVVSFYRLSVAATNLRTEPKHIVFLSQLLLLFQFCHVCNTENPEPEAKQVGTEAIITTLYQLFQPQMPQTGKYLA